MNEENLSPKPKLNLKYILIVIILAALASGGILAYAKYINKQLTSLVKIPEITKDETADWLTYRNEEFGFELKYPKDWNVSEDKEHEGIIIDSPIISNISIFPAGWATEFFQSFIGTQKESKGLLGGRETEVISSFTEENEEWFKIITVVNPPNNWDKYNLILTSMRSDPSLDIKFFTPAERPECQFDECFELSGKLNVNEKETSGRIISTFKFLEHLTFNGKKCSVYSEIANPYKNGEQIVLTQPCADNEYGYSVFRIRNGLAEHILKKDDASHGYDEIPDEKLLKFISADEIIYQEILGEGFGCSGGGTNYVNKIDLRDGNLTTVAELYFGSHCHNPNDENNTCWDAEKSFVFRDKELLKVSLICQDGASNKEFKMEHNNKVFLTKIFPDSRDVDDILNFSLLDNAFDLVKGGKNIKFFFENKPHSLNVETGEFK